MKTILTELNGTGYAVTALATFAIVVLVSIGVFLLIRSIILWYWKIDAIVENQNKQLKEQQKMITLVEQLVNKQ